MGNGDTCRHYLQIYGHWSSNYDANVTIIYVSMKKENIDT